MPRALIILAGASFLVLLAITMWLIVLNWNEKLFASTLSIAALGVAATFVAVFAGMKEINTERAFVIDWPYNHVQQSLPLVIPSGQAFEFTLSNASMRANVAVSQINGKPPKRKRPSNPDEVFSFFGELVQAQLLSSIRDFQGNKQVPSSESPSAFVPVYIPHNYRNSDSALTPLMEHNSFLNDSDVFTWEHVGIQLPKGTAISLRRIASSPEAGPEKHLVQLSKKNYFDITFEVISRGMSSGIPAYLQGSTTLSSAPSLAQECDTVRILINEKARFPKYTSQGEDSQAYQKWAADLFKEIQIRFGM